MACKDDLNGASCEENVSQQSSSCGLSLSESDKSEICFISGIVDEHLNMGGADINVFKLLGVHEQGKLIDLTGNGVAISSGYVPNYPPTNAFDIYTTEWKSYLTGDDIIESGYIGYDFGEIKLDNGLVQYGVETYVRHNVATINIKQGALSKNRVTKARLERSDDGSKWYGVAIMSLPDDDTLNTINVKHTVPSRFWRIRPTMFNGGGNDSWNVQAIEMIDYNVTSIDDVQDEIFQENRDRDYNNVAVAMKAQYDIQEAQTELTAFGIELPAQSMYLQVSFKSCVEKLARPIVIGDIIEMPSEAQFSFNLTKIKKFVEVTDVSWSADGYTPGYTPTLLRVIAQPIMATQENMDLFDNIADEYDDNGLAKYGIENLDATIEHSTPQFVDESISTQTVQADHNTRTPVEGIDTQSTHVFSPDEIASATEQGLDNLDVLNVNETGVYTEDAMPPNGLSYSEGDVLPDVGGSKNNAYHRLTYSSDTSIPTRLFKFNASKNRWIFLESDKRSQLDGGHGRLKEFYKGYNNPVNAEDI